MLLCVPSMAASDEMELRSIPSKGRSKRLMLKMVLACDLGPEFEQEMTSD